MKTKFLKLSVLALMLTLFFGCCEDCNYMSVSIDDSIVENVIVHDICNTKEALYGQNSGKSIYDTSKGEATLYVPVPSGHSLKKIKQSKNNVSFETSGKNFTPNYVVYIVKLTGLPKDKGTILYVDLEITFTSEDKCGISSKSEKKKKSEVQGDPFDGGK
jgi:hypothetical protein